MFLLNYIISLINRYNVRFQNQKASISDVKRNINECYHYILELILKPSMSDQSINYYLEQDWEDCSIQDKFFLEPQEFISNLVSSISSKFSIFEEESKKIQEDFSYIFYDFIGKILNLLKDYLPFQDKLIDILDFVELKDPMVIFKKKLKSFCDYFQIISEDEKPLLQDELIKLKNIRVDYYQDSSTNTLHMWDRIQANENLILIPKIVFYAESLPTSSAGVEQSFSQIKLLKSDLRNRLEEATLEGLVLISQEFSESKNICIDEKMIKLFLEVKKNFNKKKIVQKKSSQKTNNLNIVLETESPENNELITQKIEIEEKPMVAIEKGGSMDERKDEDDEDFLDDSQLHPIEKKVKQNPF